MEVIACIPHLRSAAGAGIDHQPLPAGTAAPDAVGACVVPELPEPSAPAVAVHCEPTLTPTDEQPCVRRSTGSRRAAPALLSPSIFVLAAVAAAVWAAALRNDRLRAIEQQRPQRVAMEPPITVGPERSLTP